MSTEKRIGRSDVIAYIKDCTAAEIGQLLIDADKPDNPAVIRTPKLSFTWEESFSGRGYYINSNGDLIGAGSTSTSNVNKNVFRTARQAVSALAFAQLSHIVHRYNNDIELTDERVPAYGVVREDKNPSQLIVLEVELVAMHGLAFLSRQDAEQSLITNKELWGQYWML